MFVLIKDHMLVCLHIGVSCAGKIVNPLTIYRSPWKLSYGLGWLRMLGFHRYFPNLVHH